MSILNKCFKYLLSKIAGRIKEAGKFKIDLDSCLLTKNGEEFLKILKSNIVREERNLEATNC